MKKALAAAQERKERVEKLARVSSPVDAVGSKRKGLKKNELLSSASTTVSSEKVTPDPKHIRTEAEPRELFPAPTGEAAPTVVDDSSAGVVFLWQWQFWSISYIFFVCQRCE